MVDKIAAEGRSNHFSPPPVSICFLLCFSLSLIGTWLAEYTLLNHDMATIIVFAREIIKGKHLYVDLFTSQFPMIIGLAMIPVQIHFLTGIPIPEAFFLFAFILLQSCALLGWAISRRNPLLCGTVQTYALLFAFYYGLFILPIEGEKFISNFGQREHLFCAFGLPYIMLMINRLYNTNSPRFERVLAGIFAALGFCIKPQFFLLFGLSEIFAMCVQRNIFAWRRLEVAIIVFMAFFYFGSMALLTPEYFKLIPRFISNYRGYESGWAEILFMVFISFITPLIVLLRLSGTSRFRVALFLTILIVGAEINYAVPKLLYFYHALPVYFLSLLLFVLVLIMSKNSWQGFVGVPLFILYVSIQTTVPHPQIFIERRADILAEAAAIAPYKTVCFLSLENLRFSAVVYAGVDWGLSTAYLEYIPSIYADWLNINREPVYHTLEEMGENESFFYEKTIKDLQHLPDAIIVVEKTGLIKFDFLRYFMQDMRFRSLWKHYEFAGRIYHHYLHSYDAIYRRKI